MITFKDFTTLAELSCATIQIGHIVSIETRQDGFRVWYRVY
jgi:hypothetical protein